MVFKNLFNCLKKNIEISVQQLPYHIFSMSKKVLRNIFNLIFVVWYLRVSKKRILIYFMTVCRCPKLPHQALCPDRALLPGWSLCQLGNLPWGNFGEKKKEKCCMMLKTDSRPETIESHLVHLWSLGPYMTILLQIDLYFS